MLSGERQVMPLPRGAKIVSIQRRAVWLFLLAALPLTGCHVAPHTRYMVPGQQFTTNCPMCRGFCGYNCGPLPYNPYACRTVTPIERYHGWETQLIPTRASDSVSCGYAPEWP